ncbi:fumarate hydratase [Thermotoga sp. Ku-13t]|uniref:FumA C-terminus/TtdB family hydratase beta subunit n=1 Tax=Thermotoga sp. Ku-13t TaxID=1755813 RepID=UPI0013EDE0A8|nr:FumA C-terminus/TtdB family hydratase beta subunit [Thermotoga sp. Ku-13t]KAF2958799.1 fumarate hydratase [Thermotoga sp. Ku-13t]
MNLLELKVGERIEYTGSMIVMRDAAQRRIEKLLKEGSSLPVDLRGTIVFYAGPTRVVDGRFAIGPTTSERMDKYLKMLFELGVMATVGKGKRSELAKKLCREYRRIYFIAPSGAAAALSEHVESIKLLAFEDLGTEAMYEIRVENFPLIVAIDSAGNDIFSQTLPNGGRDA